MKREYRLLVVVGEVGEAEEAQEAICHAHLKRSTSHICDLAETEGGEREREREREERRQRRRMQPPTSPCAASTKAARRLELWIIKRLAFQDELSL